MLGFLGVPSDLTIWGFLNSQFLATVIGAVVAGLVAKFGGKAANAASDAAAAQEAMNATVQVKRLEEIDGADAEPTAAVQNPGGRDYRADAREVVAGAKNFIADAVKKDSDGRHQRTYNAIGYYDYAALAFALHERGRLTDDQLTGAVDLFSEWRLYERGRAASKFVSQEVCERLRAAFVRLTGRR